MAERREHDGDEPIVADSRDARGGEIVLRNRRRRAIFFAGLAGFVLFALIGAIAAYAG